MLRGSRGAGAAPHKTPTAGQAETGSAVSQAERAQG